MQTVLLRAPSLLKEYVFLFSNAAVWRKYCGCVNIEHFEFVTDDGCLSSIINLLWIVGLSERPRHMVPMFQFATSTLAALVFLYLCLVQGLQSAIQCLP
ncbi:hypothetical protein ElyMa_006688200 [Elysia marginata]|uniref:Uncharacterized protein n=1 Tax=Elysia marginata TaxID=1093978 RepID=A0AAV4IPQ1_9GAST|nr:hypothetical protein ElyMa_006688200 [Elysia marginata]